MAHSRLRVYFGPEDDSVSAPAADPNRVSVSLNDVLPLLADAARNETAWLRDFDDDEVTISNDLYEVLLAYQHFRRPSA